MADFLTRLAGRTLGLVPTVQPVLAPMYAPQQQFPGAEDSQQGIPNSPERVNHVPAPGVVTEYPQRATQGQEQSLPERLPDELTTGAPFLKYDDKTDQPPALVDAISHGVYVSDGSNKRSTGNLVERENYSHEMPSPLVPQGDNQLSISPMYAPTQATHRSDRASDVQTASDRLTSLETGVADLVPSFGPASLEGRSSMRSALSQEQSTTSEHNGNSYYEESEGTEGQAYLHSGRDSTRGPTLPLPTSTGRIPPFEQQSTSETSEVSLVVDDLSTQRLNEQRVLRQQTISREGESRYSYSRIDKYEVASTPQESPAPTPTIQVTIGRIEVRATPPQKVPSRDTSTRSGPPVMGLEEYLNQRAKGGY